MYSPELPTLLAPVVDIVEAPREALAPKPVDDPVAVGSNNIQ
jgi:hypothetical protein